jgi:monothiol glutaredoxin
MRGDPLNPKCKASKLILECFTKMDIKFKTIDILSDDSLKEWLKFYSNWPSFP